MMPAIFRFIQEPSTVRLDLNDVSGFFLTRAPDLGTPEVQTSWLSQLPYDGSTLVSSRKGNATMTIGLGLKSQTLFNDWKTKVDTLVTELNRTTNVIEFRPLGALSSYLIDTYRAAPPSLVADSPSESVHLSTVTFSLVIPRHPTLRGAGAHV